MACYRKAISKEEDDVEAQMTRIKVRNNAQIDEKLALIRFVSKNWFDLNNINQIANQIYTQIYKLNNI